MTNENRFTRFELPAILLIAWAAMMFVRPYGDFPLNDDENHAIGTWNFARTGHFKFTISTTPPLRSQVVWGALWTRLFGESFDVLRASTMVLAALALIVLNRLLLLAGVRAGLRFFAALAFFFCPIFFWATHTYMTEVPYVFASLVAMYGFYRGLRNESVGWMIAGCLAVAVSWWIRQGVVNAIAPIAVLLALRERVTPRWRTFVALPIATVAAFVFLWFTRRDWMVAQQGEFWFHWKMWTEPSFGLPQMTSLVASYFLINLHNLSIIFLPLALGVVFAIPSMRATWQRVVIAWFVVVFVAFATYVVSHGTAWPYYPAARCCEITAGNIITNFSVGPPTMTDVWNGVNLYPFHLPFPVRVIATYATALIAALAFSVVAIRALPDGYLLARLCLAHAAIGTVTLPVSVQIYDRYALDSAWSMAIVFTLLIPWSLPHVRRTCSIALIAVAIFSTLSVQEYFAWNRARWAAYWDLRNHGVPLKQIDGGAEPLLFYEVAIAKDQHERRRLSFGGGKRPYVLSFSPMNGYTVVARYPWSAWFGLRKSAVVVLKREAL